MLELLLCSLLTVFPDYLYRRYVQGKRLGKEITFYSVWYELRWGITACLMLTVGLITVVFYYHPSTKTATFFFRTVPIVPETIGRVAEINVSMSELSARQHESNRAAQLVGQGMDLGRPSAARAADCLIELPPLPPDAER